MSKVLIGFCFFALCLSSNLLGQSLILRPESAIYDSVRDRYFVTDVYTASVVEIDHNFDTTVYYNSPPKFLGMVIVDDTLYVTNVNKVLSFNLETDELHRVYYIAGSGELNDITYDQAGYLYFTDVATGRIHKLNIEDGTYSTILSGITAPNGILYDSVNNYLIYVCFIANSPIRSLNLDGSGGSLLASTPYTNLDGITMDNDRNIYISSFGYLGQGTNAVYRYDRDFAEPPILIASGLNGPADIYFDKIHNTLIIPNFWASEVIFMDMDSDDDNVLDIDDNCVNIPNSDQSNSDGDAFGDVCDNCPGFDDFIDTDGDGTPDGCDNCPNDPNPGHEDYDFDGIEDACDNCPEHYNPEQEDTNGNDVGNACDYICGDFDGNPGINILDIVYLINYVYKSGYAPDPLESADVNHDLFINILDIVYLINNIYKAGPNPECVVWPLLN